MKVVMTENGQLFPQEIKAFSSFMLNFIYL